mgnify:FL=1
MAKIAPMPVGAIFYINSQSLKLVWLKFFIMLKFFKGVEIMYHSRWKNSHREAGLTYGDRLYKNNIIISRKNQ